MGIQCAGKVLLFVWMTSTSIVAQGLVADINRLTDERGSHPAAFAALGNRVLFAATLPGVGRELDYSWTLLSQ